MSSEQFIKQMVQQSPLLVVYVVGLILALVNWRRWPGPCLMATLGFAIFLLVTVAMPFIQDSVISSARNSSSTSATSLSDKLTMLWTVSNVIRAGAFGLLLAAMFGGRARASVGAFPMMPSSSMPPPMPPGYGQGPYRNG